MTPEALMTLLAREVYGRNDAPPVFLTALQVTMLDTGLFPVVGGIEKYRPDNGEARFFPVVYAKGRFVSGGDIEAVTMQELLRKLRGGVP